MTQAAVETGETAQLRPVGDLLGVIAIELERSRVLGMRLESAVCVMAVSGWTPAIAVELQQLDYLVQRLAALRDFMEELSLNQPLAGLLDISRPLDRVPLNELRVSLSGADNALSGAEGEEFFT